MVHRNKFLEVMSYANKSRVIIQKLDIEKRFVSLSTFDNPKKIRGFKLKSSTSIVDFFESVKGEVDKVKSSENILLSII